jgi:Polyketide cyclase / dehydrase and lipid transport
LPSVAASPAEVAAARAGDDIVRGADVVMDRAFTVDAPPDAVWPWLVQLGKRRAGWYLPRSVERFIPPARRAVRGIGPQWQQLQVGDVIPDYGGRNETFEVAELTPTTTLVYRSVRGLMNVTWSITLTPAPGSGADQRTRIHLRLRLGPVRRKWLAETGGELIDAVTIAGMAAGLRERLLSP